MINQKIKPEDQALTLLSCSLDIIEMITEFKKDLDNKLNNLKSITNKDLKLLQEELC